MFQSSHAILVIVLGAILGVSTVFAQEREGPSATATKEQLAVDRALDFLVQDAAKWRKERGCATCHHGEMTVWALSEAKRQGYRVDAEDLAETLKWTKNLFVPQFSQPERDHRWGYNFFSLPGIYLAMMSQTLPILSREENQRVAIHLARHQEDDGAWLLPPPNPNGSPPTYESQETIALLALLAWDPYVANDLKETQSNRAAREKALNWLANTKPTGTTQALTLRLLLDVRSGRSAEKIQPAIEQLLQQQNSDGGWSQVSGLQSDAYATGQVLWTLNSAGVESDHNAVQSAVRFLVMTQQENGAWSMAARSHPEKDTSKDRYMVPITYFGAGWATLGLVRHVPPFIDPATRHQQAFAWIRTFSGRIEVDSTKTDAPVVGIRILYELNDEQVAQLVNHLSCFAELKTLEIKSPKLTDASALRLNRLSQLRKLSLEQTSITDAGLIQLNALTNLEEINLKDSKVTEAGVEQFQKAMPKIKVLR